MGVAELCNKIGKPSFTVHDEQIATTFAVYCAISISHVCFKAVILKPSLNFSVCCIVNCKKLIGVHIWQPNCWFKDRRYPLLQKTFFVWQFATFQIQVLSILNSQNSVLCPDQLAQVTLMWRLHSACSRQVLFYIYNHLIKYVLGVGFYW